MRASTLVITAGRDTDPGAPLGATVVATSTCRSSGPTESPLNAYARNEGTATWAALEAALGVLEGGPALTFASGMAAVAAVLAAAPPGRVVLPTTCYHGVRAVLAQEAARGTRPPATEVAQTDTEAVIAALDGAALLWLEVPSNPLIEVPDVPELCAAARARGVPVAVDATLATPLGCRALAHGADFAVHSVTKFIGGHSDLLLGVVAARTDALAAALQRARSLYGATPGALEAMLALRGLRTLALRLGQAESSATVIAARMANHRAIARVHHPSLAGAFERVLERPGALLAFELVGGAAAAERVVRASRIVVHATSLGGVESTWERRVSNPVPPGLVRLSVGCEDVEDLWADIEHALAAA